MIRQVLKSVKRRVFKSHLTMSQTSNVVPDSNGGTSSNRRFDSLLAGKKDFFLSQLDNLVKECQEMKSYCHEYDFRDVKQNGWRSFLTIMDIYFNEIERLLIEENANQLTKKNRRLLTEYEAAARFFTKQVNIMKLIRSKDMNEENSNEVDKDESNLSKIDLEILEGFLKIEPTDLVPLFTEIRNFWLLPHSRTMMEFFQNRLVSKVLPLHQSIRLLFDPEFRRSSNINYSLNAPIELQKKVWLMTEDNLAKAINTLKYLRSKGRVYWISVPRQSRVYLKSNGELSIDEPDISNNRTYNIPSMVVSYSMPPSNQRLIFHCHGGGFVAMTPQGHEPYLRIWSEALQVPVFCPNYGKAPENPYPLGLQDIIDAYLFITSGNDEVKRLIGFHPKEIVFTGDSAGGNLALALLQVIHELNKKTGTQVMPVGLLLCYPVAHPSVLLSASRSFVSFDPLLTISACFGIATAYTGIAVDTLLPWWRRDTDEVSAIFKEISKKKKDPLFNPLSCTIWDEITDIPLSIQASQYDTLLDDAIAIAKVWKGPVHLDVIEGVPHGYLMGAGSKAFQGAIDGTIERLKASFEGRA